LASDAQPRSATETPGATTTTTPTEETTQLHVEVGEEDEIEIEETTELLRQMDIRELEKLERIAQVINKLKGGDGSQLAPVSPDGKPADLPYAEPSVAPASPQSSGPVGPADEDAKSGPAGVGGRRGRRSRRSKKLGRGYY
jgi:hypothetical protein